MAYQREQILDSAKDVLSRLEALLTDDILTIKSDVEIRDLVSQIEDTALELGRQLSK